MEIRGSETAKAGQTLNFECTTSNSNPASTLHWEVDGSVMSGVTNITEMSADGGWVSASNISVNIHQNDKTKTISCFAKNAALGETKVETHIVTVLCKCFSILSLLKLYWHYVVGASQNGCFIFLTGV